mmetsp:Transcript_18014/g.58825  ORF Transcript_18014/g.58825 Transcript_18014/m.58825 type:complete len:208 (-) Transcript_18014:293-916(-)|eukprot:CAMPEP_0170139880 /NCGR_PEP_ID=MMETSP0033_2-20121228/5972_1 /TAXON_ID=195969 /ORGANISM="Dolichomastix tenuilepis, Strain CCMP3274" /LENGTH=207 /DNA_ID=CAMNT_0010376037 /DNA_START=13 /DNA_END=636 /DNA_ORIENTATION=-
MATARAQTCVAARAGRRAGPSTRAGSALVAPQRSSAGAKAFLGGTELQGRGVEAGASLRGHVVMAAKVTGMIKLAIEAGKASPAPPIGPALGAKGVNIMMFCKEYNARTADKAGLVIPVEISVFEDKSFTFILKTPPASVLLKKAAGIETGAGEPNRQVVGTITEAQLKEIAEIKLPDLNANDVQAAMRIVEGTAKNMGVKVEYDAA